MGEWFGLGIMIQVRDFASQGLAQVTNSFNNTRRAIDEFSTRSSESLQELSSTAEQHFQNMTIAGLGMQQAGNQFLSFSNKMINPLKNIASEVVTTSAQFENWKKTLKALYKDEKIANEKLQWGMNLAAETPFEVSDVTQALIAFKAIGAEADKTLTSTNGVKQSILEFVGDLASLRPDVGLDGVMMGVRNLIGGDGGKSLTMRMDMDLEAILGRSWGDTTEQIMQDLADVSGKIANGLMGELEGTWDQIVSNLEDQKTRFQKALGDAGVFDAVKESLQAFATVISGIDDNKMAKIGESLAQAFTMIWKPIDLVIKVLSKVAEAIINVVASSPLLGKIVAGFLAIGGAITGVIGAVLIFGGGIITTISSLGLFLIALRNTIGPTLNMRTALSLLGNTMGSTLLKLSKLAGAFALGFAVWKFDIGGVRTMATNLVNTILYAFRESAKISRMGADDMIKAVSQLDMTDFGDRLTYRLLQLRVLWQAVCEAWSDYTLSEDTFKKVQALGLLPLLNAILDFKMKFEAFWSGFKEGFKDVSDTIAYVFKTVAEAIGKVYTFLFPVNNAIKKTKDAMNGEGLNLAPWKAVGYIFGGLASIFATGMIATKIFGVIKSIASLGLSILRLPFRIFSIASGTINFLLTAVGKLGGVFARIFPSVFGFARTLMTLAMAHPIIAIISLVLASLIPIFVKLWRESDSFREGIIAMATNIMSFVGMVALAIGAFIGTIVIGVVSIATVIAQVLATVVVIIGAIVSSIVVIVGSCIAIVVGAISTAIATIISIITLIVATVTTVGTIIQGIFQTAFAIVQGIIQTFLAIVKAVMTGDFTTLGETIKSIWQGVGNRIGDIWSNVASTVKSIWTGVQSFLSGIWGAMQSMWTGICNGIQSAGTSVVNGIKSAWSGVTGFFSGIWGGIKSGASSMFSWIEEKFSWLSGKISSAKDAMSKIGNGISSVFGGGKDGSHANGLSYVPYDGYVAELHKGEMVLTAQESKKYRQQGRGVLDNLLSEASLPIESPISRNLGGNQTQLPSMMINNITQDLTIANPIETDEDKKTERPIIIAPQMATDNSAPVLANNIRGVNPLLAQTPTSTNSDTPQSVDNSVTFSEGSIQINVQNGEDLDLNKIAKQLMEKIQREQQLRNTLRYKHA